MRSPDSPRNPPGYPPPFGYHLQQEILSQQEMEGFDRLPEAWKALVRESPVEFVVRDVEQFIRVFGYRGGLYYARRAIAMVTTPQ